jgi:hypothetical protein
VTVYVIVGVPLPAVIVPPVTAPTVARPRPAYATEALLPIELRTNAESEAIVASGAGFTVSSPSWNWLLAGQVPLITTL